MPKAIRREDERTPSLSEPQQSLVDRLRSGGTLQFEQATGRYRLQHNDKVRTVQPSTVQSLLDRGVLFQDLLGAVCIAQA